VYQPVLLLVALLLCLGVAHVIYRAGAAPVRAVESWYCGEPHTDAEVRYPATSFYGPFKALLTWKVGGYQPTGLYPHLRLPRIKPLTGWRRFLGLDEWLYDPLVKGLRGMLDSFSRTHVGIPQVYVLWMVLGVVMAIIFLFWLS
jgi:hydrogenase-4 component B